MDLPKSTIEEEIKNIPLADDDPQAILPDDDDAFPDPKVLSLPRNTSVESISCSFANDNNSTVHNTYDTAISPDELEEKARLITQVLELQNTLDDLSHRVDSVKDETLKLSSENQVLGQYIENLMSASSIFQSTSPKAKKK